MRNIILIIFLNIFLIINSHADIGDTYYCKADNILVILDDEPLKFEGERFMMKLYSDHVIIDGGDTFFDGDSKLSVDTELAAVEVFSGLTEGRIMITYYKGTLFYSSVRINNEEERAVNIFADCIIYN